MNMPRVFRRRLCIILGVSLMVILIPFLAMHKLIIACNLEAHTPNWIEKYESIHPEHINEILRILQTTPNLWGYRGQEGVRNETVATRVQSQMEWVKNLGRTSFINSVKLKNILVYLEPSEGDQYFDTENKLKCPYAPEFENKCRLIFEKRGWMDLIKNHPPQSYYTDLEIDAVIGVRNGYWGMDTWNSEPTLPPGIHQIYHVHESPCHTGSAPLGRNGAWLSSYWRGADIPIPYAQYVKVQGNGSSSIINYSLLPETVKRVDKDNRRLVVALISNCGFVQNDRMGYITQLQKYIPVDIFGKCGGQNLSCPQHGDCLSHLGSRYKFYLSFENCNCEDYITEKFFVNALQHNMVPVVMGAAPENYARSAPPHSFIHVNQFPTPMHLAKYLQMLDKNEHLYKKYWEWSNPSREGWRLTYDFSADFFCRACGLLYYADIKPPPPYPNCSTRWKDLNQCLTKNEWRWPT